MQRTTKKHFEVFKKECKKWIDVFGLKGWYINYYHENWNEAEETGEAWCAWEVKPRCASLCLCTEWDDSVPLTNKMIKRAAFHEVMHILLGRLFSFALTEDEKIPYDIKAEEVHSLIRIFENIFFERRK